MEDLSPLLPCQRLRRSVILCTGAIAYGKCVDTVSDKHCADTSQLLQQLFAH
jgi:hypothetical protein